MNDERELTEMEEKGAMTDGNFRNVFPLPETEINSGGFDCCREYNYFVEDDCDVTDERKKQAAHLLLDSHSSSLQAESLFASTQSRSSLLDQHPMEENTRTYILGKVYHPVKEFDRRRADESSLFWYTYRYDFPEIKPYGICTDAGWGCMLRSAQMLLCQALRVHYKSREWGPPQSLDGRRYDPFIRSVMTWFADFPSTTDCVYSLHNMVASGLANYDKLPGEWYGPGTACYVLRDLVEMHDAQQRKKLLCGQLEQRHFRVHVASNGEIYRDEIHALMTRDSRHRSNDEQKSCNNERVPAHPLDVAWEEELVEPNTDVVSWDTALLLLIPLRLGLDSFNEEYAESLSHTFSFPQSVGILGGRPRGARWFYGAMSDGSKIFGLDPHTIQAAPQRRSARVNGKVKLIVDLSDEYLRSVHTNSHESIALMRMDPSMALGFYFRNANDLSNFVHRLLLWKQSHPTLPALFHVADAMPDYSTNVSSSFNDMMFSSAVSSLVDKDEQHQLSDEDDYIIL